MNTSNIKRYAPQARKNFIAAITKQAAKYGITANGIEPLMQKGDLALIGERPFPAAIIKPRAALIQKIKQLGFTQVIEQVAYCWFNRLCALRYMELKDYLDHGRRVLSSPNQTGSFQILDECLDIELSSLDQAKIRTLKLDGTQDEQLYRELLLAQCHALHKAMPFLFERIGDETELLLPENLTKTDSLIHELVNEIPEEDWHSVEIIGWLYQFYISEKKDEVIGKVVKSEDIPAATQLFTPNWIVKYMVQNSLGAQWLATYPESPLKASMEYYITPATQTDEVNAQLKAITPSALNPEELTLIDPACGSGHILVEAYDLFKAIYLERGYRKQDLAKLILEKNLFGLDIDTRAAQLTGFALMMKGRDDDRRLFERDIKLNVMAMVDSIGFDVDALSPLLRHSQDISRHSREGGNPAFDVEANDLIELKKLFEYAATFGSLIQVPSGLKEKLPALKRLGQLNTEDLFSAEAQKKLMKLVGRAELLSSQYNIVAANPPYMGGNFYNKDVKDFVEKHYKIAKGDLYTCFMLRCHSMAKCGSPIAMLTIPNWMSLSTYEGFRKWVLDNSFFETFSHNGRGAFGSDFGSCAFTFRNVRLDKYKGSYKRLFDKQGSVASNEELKLRYFSTPPFISSAVDFKNIPSCSIAYWLSNNIINIFSENKSIGDSAISREGMTTADNDIFLRYWFEVDNKQIAWASSSYENFSLSGKKWIPYIKGGDYRKWYGNTELVVNWKNDGSEIKTNVDPKTGRIRSHNYNGEYAFREGFTWTLISSGSTAARFIPAGFMFDANGPMAFLSEKKTKIAIGLINSNLGAELLKALSPTLAFKHGHILSLPLPDDLGSNLVENNVDQLIAVTKKDWDSREVSWDFCANTLTENVGSNSIESCWLEYKNKAVEIANSVKLLEFQIGECLADSFNVKKEINNEVNIEKVTLFSNHHSLYGGDASGEEKLLRHQSDKVKELISYSIGCMMGRYSLDEPGLIYAHSGNEGFDPNCYQAFKADDDGIIPLTDKEWFSDDGANRLEEFISVAWEATHLEENLGFLADNLSPKKGESSRETIRRYLCDSFYKDHTQTYKKRPDPYHQKWTMI